MKHNDQCHKQEHWHIEQHLINNAQFEQNAINQMIILFIINCGGLQLHHHLSFKLIITNVYTVITFCGLTIRRPIEQQSTTSFDEPSGEQRYCTMNQFFLVDGLTTSFIKFVDDLSSSRFNTMLTKIASSPTRLPFVPSHHWIISTKPPGLTFA